MPATSPLGTAWSATTRSATTVRRLGDDLSTNQSTTVVRKTCHTSTGYEQASVTRTVGHQYQVVLESRDDAHLNDASYTFVDDISLS